MKMLGNHPHYRSPTNRGSPVSYTHLDVYKRQTDPMLTHHPESLLGHLATLPDPRRREGRRYPLASLLGMVVLGMLHGQDSLLRAWTWAFYRWGTLWRVLGAHSPHFPAYNTVRTLLASLDADAVDQRLRPWMATLVGAPVEEDTLEGISADGKVLRGSKRATCPALRVVELVTHTHGFVLAQREAVDGDEVRAFVALLTEVPLAGRLMSMDAGLLNATITQLIRDHDGHSTGSVKGNQLSLIHI